MLRKNIQWPKHRQFRSKSEWEPIGFFSDCLCYSSSFDLMLGFFSSSAIQTLSDGFSIFLHNGGKMRLIINNFLSKKDKDIIIAGTTETPDIPFDLSDIENLKKSLSDRDKHFFDCLSWLIANKRIDIKIISIKNEYGIAHTKEGVFSDGTNKVGFNGSCNFTQTALIGNRESISAICDWDGDIDKYRVEHITQAFENTFSETDDTVNYLTPKDIITEISNNFPNKSIEDLLTQEERLFHDTNKIVRPSIQKAMQRAKKEVKEKIEKEKTERDKPRFPFDKPREYQIKAFEKWKNNNQQGLFAMATGTGKTITSLNCLLEIYKKLGYYKAVILVPTITLVNQWEIECEKFNFNTIIKVSSKNPNWRNEIANIHLKEKLNPTKEYSYIVIATYASFVKSNTFDDLNNLSFKSLLIADECHNMGSKTLVKLLPKIKFHRRIGLSATPERQFDNEGNKKLSEFFNSVTEYTYEYSMKEAIDKGVLCSYYYYPYLVSLTETEMQEYLELSHKIAKFYNQDIDSFTSDPILTALLLKRKRIIHKAYNKLSVFRDILIEEFEKRNNLSYTLVYVPEGNDTNDYYETDFYDNKDEDENDLDSAHLIDVYTKIIRDIDNRLTVRKFISGVNDRDLILDQFSNKEIDVLTSMKCLDEGVDVPRAELAVFCASTGNPRQFIQRRGRILRQHTEKKFAFIYDLVVIPEVNRNGTNFNMERSMLKKEIERVKNFSLLALNSAYTLNVLSDVMNYYNLNLYHND